MDFSAIMQGVSKGAEMFGKMGNKGDGGQQQAAPSDPTLQARQQISQGGNAFNKGGLQAQRAQESMGQGLGLAKAISAINPIAGMVAQKAADQGNKASQGWN